MSFLKIFTLFSPKSAHAFFSDFSFQQESSFEYTQDDQLHIESLGIHKNQIITNFKVKPLELQLYSNKFHTQKPDFNAHKLRSLLTDQIANFHLYLINTAQESVKLEALSKVESDHAQEIQGVEWLRVSIEVLKKAIQHCLDHDELIYHQLVITKDSEHGREIRMRVLSLDFKIVFLRDSRLEITCWNFKDSTEKSAEQAPAFKGYFYHQKNQVIEQFIPLIKQMSVACTRLKEL